MEHHADPVHRRKPEPHGKAERMKKRQNAQHFVTAQHEYLRDLPDVGDEVMVRQHHAFCRLRFLLATRMLRLL